VDKYQPQLVWFDWWIEEPAFEPYRKAFAAYYYNRAAQWGRGVAINYKNQAFPPEAAVYDIERGQLDDCNPHFWQTDTAVAKNSWGYTTDLDYKTSESIVGDLVDIVSKNGALLLNIGPAPDGTIPEPDERILLEIGNWLAVNGEAVFSSRPWRVFGEGPTQVLKGGFTDTKRSAFTSQDIRFTPSSGALYATVLAWPENGEVTIQSLGTNLRLYPKEVGNVQLLGSSQPLKWARGKAGLKVKLPEAKPCEAAYVVKVTPKG